MSDTQIKRVSASVIPASVEVAEENEKTNRLIEYFIKNDFSLDESEYYLVTNESNTISFVITYLKKPNQTASVVTSIVNGDVDQVKGGIDRGADSIRQTELFTIKHDSVISEDTIKTSSSGPVSSRDCKICKKIVAAIPKMGTVTVAAVCAIVGAQIAGPPGAASGAACEKIAQEVINYMSSNTTKSPKSVCQTLGYCP